MYNKVEIKTAGGGDSGWAGHATSSRNGSFVQLYGGN